MKKRQCTVGALGDREYVAFLKNGRERLDALQDRAREISRGVFAGLAGARVAYGQEERAMTFVLKLCGPFMDTDTASE